MNFELILIILGQFGKEIEFRSKLEAELRKGRSIKYYQNMERKQNVFNRRSFLRAKNTTQNRYSYLSEISSDQDVSNQDNEQENDQEKVPMILICVQGGLFSLETVLISIQKNIPVLILAVSIQHIHFQN